MTTYFPLSVCSSQADAGEVQVISALPSEGTYKTCGSIRIHAGGLVATDEIVLNAVKETARQQGANRIVIVEQPDAKWQATSSVLSQGMWSYIREGSAIAIRVDAVDPK